MSSSDRQPRVIEVPPNADGMRLDRFLAARFTDRSRSWIARGIRQGDIQLPGGRVLRAATPVRAGQLLQVFLDGIAPAGQPPPLPPVLYEDDRVVVLDKPAGMLVHPVGTDFAWGLVGLARQRWPHVHVVHRLDRDTSGVLVLALDADANRALKLAMREGAFHKEYEALARGVVPWETATLDGPIGPAGGVIRIQMAVRPDGQPARTTVDVLRRGASATWVRCVLHTGRTHQIRVHLAHAGHPLLGDRMYGVAPAVFLRTLDVGVDREVIEAAGAPRQALHAARVRFPHPDGRDVEVEAPTPADLRRWWDHPEILPLDGFEGALLPEPAGEVDADTV